MPNPTLRKLLLRHRLDERWFVAPGLYGQGHEQPSTLWHAPEQRSMGLRWALEQLRKTGPPDR